MAFTRVHKLAKAAPILKSAVKPLVTGKVEDWHGEYAYSLGLQAFIYGFPYIYNAQIRHKWVTQPRNPKFVPVRRAERVLARRAADGRHVSRRRLPEQRHALLDRVAGSQRGADHPLAPRHGRALLHLRADGRRIGQLRLHRPARDRLEGGQLRDRRPRLGGRAARRRRPVARPLAEPEGAGHRTHAGRTARPTSPTVKELQEQYLLTPLSQWGKADVVRAERRDVLEPIEPEQDPLGPFKTLNAMLEENPPPAASRAAAQPVRADRDRPGLDIEDAAGCRQAGSDAGRAARDGAAQAAVPERRLGEHRQRLALSAAGDRALRRRLPAPRRRPIARRDHVQRPRRGASTWSTSTTPTATSSTADRRYQMHFDADDMPPVDSFWSLGMYGTDLNLVPNPIERYSIGDRTAGLKQGRRRRADDLPAVRVARRRRGSELAALTSRRRVVRDPAHVPAAARGDRRDLGMPANRTGASEHHANQRTR